MQLSVCIAGLCFCSRPSTVTAKLSASDGSTLTDRTVLPGTANNRPAATANAAVPAGSFMVSVTNYSVA